MSNPPDFPDWISPMLVKELRQGMRSRVFLVSFLALQVAMIFLAMIGLLSWKDESASTGITAFFWIIIGAPLLCIMPLSGLAAISGEQKAGTLDLIFLSRLSARRIVLGKWLAIVAQTILLVCAILPYVVLRYYLGGVDLAANLKILGWLFLASAVLTALAVALSPSTGRVARAIVPIGFILGLQFLGLVSQFNAFSGSGSVGSSAAATTAGYLLLAFLFLFFMLEMGAGKIAPEAENHSTPKRLIALALLLSGVFYSLLFPGISWFWTSALYLLAPICIGAVCEPVRKLPRVYRPFVRRGWPGRFLGLVLYPGWPSGVLFSLVVLFILFLLPHGPFASLFAGSGPHPIRHILLGTFSAPGSTPAPAWSLLVAVSIVGSFFLPAALLRLVKTRSISPVLLYILFQIALALLTLLANTGSGGLKGAVAVIPLCSLLLASTTSSWGEPSITAALLGTTILTILSLLVLFTKMIPCWKMILALEKTSAARDALSSETHVLPSSEPA